MLRNQVVQTEHNGRAGKKYRYAQRHPEARVLIELVITVEFFIQVKQ